MALAKEQARAFKDSTRSMFFSAKTIDSVLESASAGQLRCIMDMIALEQDVRAVRKRERMFRKAAFPQIKSFDGYDFSQVSFPENYDADRLKGLEFIDQGQDFVFHGQTGRGKTHLAIATGVSAVKRGWQVRFFTTAMLIMMLKKACENATLDALLADIGKCDLLILDEFGYVPTDVEGARLLFQVVADCYEKRSLILTTNIEFGRWGTVLGDEKLAATMIDRIIHHGRLVEFGGESKRMEASLMLGKGEA